MKNLLNKKGLIWTFLLVSFIVSCVSYPKSNIKITKQECHDIYRDMVSDYGITRGSQLVLLSNSASYYYLASPTLGVIYFLMIPIVEVGILKLKYSKNKEKWQEFGCE
ncbi:MAG: hypothetical protein SFU98_10180 [Leptospiraceae bacterium]|nr:hypothetical protein [Leptospiraceae bacterium]